MSNETKWTPGPWHVGRTVGGMLIVRPVDKRRGTVAALTDETALVYGEWAQRDYTNAEANANLIAAAPKLYEALCECLEHMEWSTEQGRQACEKARAALAKARGEKHDT